MHHSFWHERWEQEQIGFHQQEINRYLIDHWEELGVEEGAPVFVPLCGKSLDIHWLREQGHPVFGVELSRKAIEEFFDESGIEPSVNETERFIEFSGDRITLFAGDYFALRDEDLGEIRAVFDRAALIALPEEMRRDYAAKMATLVRPGGHILLITMQYAPGVIDGPPFSVEGDEVEAIYGDDFRIEERGRWEAAGPRGVPVQETVLLLTRK